MKGSAALTRIARLTAIAMLATAVAPRGRRPSGSRAILSPGEGSYISGPTLLRVAIETRDGVVCPSRSSSTENRSARWLARPFLMR